MESTISWVFTRNEYKGMFLYAYSLLNFLLSVASPYPAKVMAYVSPIQLIRVLVLIQARKIDTVILDHDELFWIVKYIPSCVKVISISHNNEVELYSQRVHEMGFYPILKPVLALDMKKFRRYIDKVYQRLDIVITISLTERDRIQQRFPNTTCIFMPPRFLVTRRSPLAEEKANELVFIGNTKWGPNLAGLKWFLSNVLPKLSPSIRLKCVGELASELTEYKDRVEYLGYVESLDDIWDAAKLMIAPIFEGSGANVKLAEYLANGKPVITTKFCAQPYGLQYSDCFISNNADEWIDYINGVFSGHEPIVPSLELIDRFTYS